MNNAQTRNAGPGVAVMGDINNTTGAAQRQRVLAYLRDIGPANTMFLRDELNVMMPAARIKELRARGHKISTARIAIHDRDGRIHRGVARYTLIELARGCG